jgi:hypothetical protein
MVVIMKKVKIVNDKKRMINDEKGEYKKSKIVNRK